MRRPSLPPPSPGSPMPCASAVPAPRRPGPGPPSTGPKNSAAPARSRPAAAPPTRVFGISSDACETVTIVAVHSAETQDLYEIVRERIAPHLPALAACRNSAELWGLDLYRALEPDIRRLARDLARALGMHYAFVPCYLNLTKGSGIEQDLRGSNDLGLHGNALLSRYPMGNVRPVFLENGVDIMASREKRIGRQAAVAADIRFPNGTITAVSVHLDAQSTQRHRYRQLRDVLDSVGAAQAVVVGGDWNTSTYNSSRALHAILGFWLRVLMGVDNVIRNHYLHPYRRFERDLFRLLEERGFDYRESNRLGEHTVSYDVEDLRATKAL